MPRSWSGLAETSHPRVVVDTSGLSPAATELANLLAAGISRLESDEIRSLIDQIEAALEKRR